jgi:plasmid stability protein
MNQIVIRNLDDEILQRLKQIAWQEGRPPEEMARHLLIEAVRSRAARRTLHEVEAQGSH